LATRFPVLRVLGGILFVLAGAAYYFGITVAFSAPLVFIVAGAAVVLLALIGHRARGGDVAIFVIGLLVLGFFITPGIGLGSSSSQLV